MAIATSSVAKMKVPAAASCVSMPTKATAAQHAPYPAGPPPTITKLNEPCAANPGRSTVASRRPRLSVGHLARGGVEDEVDVLAVSPDPGVDEGAQRHHLEPLVPDVVQLQTLQDSTSGSVLAGHLDLTRIAMVGHSLGGATAERVLAEDDRLAAAVNVDGRIFGSVPSLNRPYLWLQNEATANATTRAEHPTGDLADMAQLERQLLARQTGPGGLLVVDGTRHLDFTDIPAYFSPLGRRLLGSYTNTSTAGVDRMTALTADLIEEFLGDLSRPGAVSVEQLAARHAGVTPYAGE